MPVSWYAFAPAQRAMLLRISRDGPLAVGDKTEMRTVASLKRRGLLRPSNARADGADTRGRWCLTSSARKLVERRLEQKPDAVDLPTGTLPGKRGASRWG